MEAGDVIYIEANSGAVKVSVHFHLLQYTSIQTLALERLPYTNYTFAMAQTFKSRVIVNGVSR